MSRCRDATSGPPPSTWHLETGSENPNGEPPPFTWHVELISEPTQETRPLLALAKLHRQIALGDLDDPPSIVQTISTVNISTKHRRPDLELTEAMFLILVAVADEERHGYAVMQEVAEETEGRVRLGPGTLYRSLKRLLDGGLIAEAERRPGPEEDERRRYYRITDAGRSAALDEARRLEAVLSLARRRSLAPAGVDRGDGS